MVIDLNAKPVVTTRQSRVSGYPIQLALLGPPRPGLLPMQAFTPGPASQLAKTQDLLDRFWKALRERRLLEPGGAFDLLQQIDPDLSSQAFQDPRGQLAAELENGGQQVISWYATGDEFPLYPPEIQKRQFELGADFFDRAAQLRRATSAPEWHDLEARKWFCRGRSLMYEKKFEEAIAAFESAIRIDAEAPEPYNAMGIAHVEKARFKDAEQRFQEAIRRAPGWTFPRHNLALTYVETGDYNSALFQYRTAIKLTPYYPYLYHNLGLLLQRLNKKGEAAQEYRRALERFSERAEEYSKRAGKLQALTDKLQTAGQEEDAERAREDAKQSRRKAVVLMRTEAEVHNALGSLRHSQGKTEAAKKQYDQALQLDPELYIARHNLGLAYARPKGDLDMAIRIWSENVKRKDDFLPSLLCLADAYVRKGDFAQGAAQYQAVANLPSAPATIRQEAARRSEDARKLANQPPAGQPDRPKKKDDDGWGCRIEE